MLAALREHLPIARIHGIAAGLHLLITMPEGVDDIAVAARDKNRGGCVHGWLLSRSVTGVEWAGTGGTGGGRAVGHSASSGGRSSLRRTALAAARSRAT